MANKNIIKDLKKPDYKNPTLKEYFKIMKKNQKTIIQFSQKKMQRMITDDLGIDMNSYSDLLKEVAIEMLGYYMQTYPEWKTQTKSLLKDADDQSFELFKTYLITKIHNLSQREQEFLEKSTEPIVPPDDIFNLIPKSSYTRVKTKCPYTLEITAPMDKFSSLQFKCEDQKTISINFQNTKTEGEILTTNEVMNYPYVNVTFRLPGIIEFARTNVHNIKMYLCKQLDTWDYLQDNREYGVDIPIKNATVFQYDLIVMFFNQLKFMMSLYENKIPLEKRNEILELWEHFINDMEESKQRKLQEYMKVSFNIGGFTYIMDKTDFGKNMYREVTFRKVLTPAIEYSLKFCRINTEMSVINWCNANSSLHLSDEEFVQQIKSSVIYQCTMCDKEFSGVKLLENHLLEIHPILDLTLQCFVCKSHYYKSQLLLNRWKHSCPDKNKTPTAGSSNYQQSLLRTQQ